ncbi:MAG TPA: type II toxin-antitoxin system PrlF family antitoxin [Thermoanaerobaculia bacterium]|nr:type II toxin-antitoxin system PrlF family antitoxin [Thermoanaerobaculia bacterium]
MPEATITSKGQITIPKEVREALNVQAGDVLDFVINERGEVTVRTLRGDVRRLRGMLKHLVKRPLTVEEMDEAILRHHARKR